LAWVTASAWEGAGYFFFLTGFGAGGGVDLKLFFGSIGVTLSQL
jgi:hypothetical protein